MDRRDRLEFAKHSIQVPPRVDAGEVQMLLIDFPTDTSDITYENGWGTTSFCPPSEAFDEASGKLIVFIEADWAYSAFNGRYLPKTVRSDISDGSFSHELCALEDYSPESLLSFIAEHGWLFLPYLESQRRFLDFRYHCARGDEGGAFPYEDVALDDLSKRQLRMISKRPDGAARIELQKAIRSVWRSVFKEAGIFPDYGDTMRPISMHRMADAVVLSEFSRRSLLSVKTAFYGGAIAYYEVLLTVKALQQSMRLVEEYDIAGTDLAMLRKGIGFPSTRAMDEAFYGAVREVLDDGSITDLQKTYRIHNLYESHLTKAVRFLSRCAFSSPGTGTLGLRRLAADGDELYEDEKWFDNRFVTLEDGKRFNAEYLDRRMYLNRVDPGYFDSIYSEGSYSAAVAAQFLDVVNNNLNWKVCKNPECGRYFKLKHAPGKVTTRERQGDYCCEKCGSDMRNKRNNAEHRIIVNAKRRLEKRLPGYETIEAATKSVESAMAPFYEGDEVAALPKARARWRRKLSG